MTDDSVNILIGGEAGQGLVTIGGLIAKALVRSGYEIHVTQDYLSRIRGGHNTYAVRFAAREVAAPAEKVDVLVALNDETVERHKDQLTERAVVIAGDSTSADLPRLFKAPLEDLAPKEIFHNTAALGVLASVICLDIDVLKKLLADTFKKKGKEVIDQNVEVLEKAYAWKEEQKHIFACPAPPENGDGNLSMNGNEAIALGAMAAGVNFLSFYPMTPSTSVPLTLIAHAKELGIVAEQAEDEIAALNMALGASYAGGRALVATSGGGFALMTEAVSLAGMTETPVVIVIAQRPGPATGLPTRTEQGDLFLALFSGHGEFPRAVLAPGTPEECFHLTHKAFDLAEKYQSPVFVLTDQYLADSTRAVAPFDLDDLPPVAGPLLEVEDAEGYERFAYTESGVSPRAIPGLTKALVLADSDEHTPDGHITEDHGVRVRMHDKRNSKYNGLFSEVAPPAYDGPDHPELLLVCWGSSRGAVLEAAAVLRSEGRAVATMHFTQVWPLDPDHFIPRFAQAGAVVMVEGNSTGHLRGLIRMQTGWEIERLVSRYDGLPFTAEYILNRLRGMDA